MYKVNMILKKEYEYKLTKENYYVFDREQIL